MTPGAAAVPLPDGALARPCRIGGVSKEDLRSRLDAAGVRLNPLAIALFEHPGFATSAVGIDIETVELTVAQFGRPEGATMPVLLAQAAHLGLRPCPLETGPHRRLQWPDQPEGAIGEPPTQGCAPPGAVTIVSPPIGGDDAPRGFYLRCIDGVPWLRGYRSDDAHVWAPQDRLMFQREVAPRAPQVGVGVLVWRDGRVLLGRRRGAHGAGTWSAPGGRLEYGESIDDCARRELLEETGLCAEVVAPGPVSSDVFADNGAHFVTVFVVVRHATGEPTTCEPDKCEGWAWFDPADLPQPLFLPLHTLVRRGDWPPEGSAP